MDSFGKYLPKHPDFMEEYLTAAYEVTEHLKPLFD